MLASIINFVRDIYGAGYIPLHAPYFKGNEKKYLVDTVDSSYVSSVGAYVDQFEKSIAEFTGSPKAVAVVNGTSGLHLSLVLSGIRPGDLVLTQALTFIATCNAIQYCNAEPVFIDVDIKTLSLSPKALEAWLAEQARVTVDGSCQRRSDGRTIRACVPMHTFGHPADLDGLIDVCTRWGITLVEDAAESLGSYYKEKHTGTFGKLGVISFNGNKIITTGGGGMILTDEDTYIRAKHLSTTGKKPHPYEFVHDVVAYNYRMPNVNAALGCAQLEQLDTFINAKRILAKKYEIFFKDSSYRFVTEPLYCRSNYWLNAVICEDRNERDALLTYTNDHGVTTRPIWKLMTRLPMFESCQRGDLTNSEWLEDRVVNLPSSVPQVEA